jgi:hypothetical protein
MAFRPTCTTALSVTNEWSTRVANKSKIVQLTNLKKSYNIAVMSSNVGTLTWCKKCKAFHPCEVVVSPDNGIYKSDDEGYRLRDRLCKNCGTFFTTYEVDSKYFRNLKWRHQLAIRELEYAKMSRDKIQELVDNLLNYFKEDNEFWMGRDSLFTQQENSALSDQNVSGWKRRFPTKSELEALKASIKSTLESKNLDSDPHLRLVENFKDDQQDD